MVGNCELPLSKPSIEPRRITAEELQLFWSPDNLHGKQFILSPGTDESGTYEVIEYSRKRDKTIQYEVLFDDCADPAAVNAKEMMAMLKDSIYLPAWSGTVMLSRSDQLGKLRSQAQDSAETRRSASVCD
jgi:hypothetical protein